MDYFEVWLSCWGRSISTYRRLGYSYVYKRRLSLSVYVSQVGNGLVYLCEDLPRILHVSRRQRTSIS